MSYTDDPIADFNAHDAEQQRWLDSLPKCCECREPIQQEDAVFINDYWYCDECLDYMRRGVGDD